MKSLLKEVGRVGMAGLVLTLLGASCQSQVLIPAPKACSSHEAARAAAELQLRKVVDIADLIRQIRDNLRNGVLCADPELLEQRWGIQIEGRWRQQRGGGLPPVPVRLEGNKTYFPLPLDRFLVTINAREGDLLILFAPGHAAVGESLLSHEALSAILGSPQVEVDILHPSPTPGTPVPRISGPFPNSILRWWPPTGKGGSISARTASGSEIVNLQFSMNLNR